MGQFLNQGLALFQVLLLVCHLWIPTDCQHRSGKVATTFPAMIRGKRELQDHFFTSLTQIIASFRRSAMIVSRTSPVFCTCRHPAELRVNLGFGRFYAPEKSVVTHPFKLNTLATLCAGSG